MMAPVIETDTCLLKPHFAADSTVFWSLRTGQFAAPLAALSGEAAHALASWFIEGWDGREVGQVTLARRTSDNAMILAFALEEGEGASVETHDAANALCDWAQRFLGCAVIVPALPESGDDALPFLLPPRRAA